jgi:ATP-dependent Lon protease
MMAEDEKLELLRQAFREKNARVEELEAELADARSDALDDVIRIIDYARERGERDLRQFKYWAEALRKQSADEFLAEMPPTN